MSTQVRIGDDLYSRAQKVASSEFRTIQGQIELWAKVGMCALDNPDLPVEFIKDILISKSQGSSLAEPFVPDHNRV